MYKNILILNLTRMGDLVQSTPLIAGLREKYSDAKITLVVSSDFAEFSKRVPGVDEIIVFNLKQFEHELGTGKKSWVSIYRYLEDFLDGISSKAHDYLVNLSHSRLSAFMIQYLGIKNRCGFGCNEAGERFTEHPWMEYFGTEPFNRIYNPFNLVEIFARCADVRLDGKAISVGTFPEDFSEADVILSQENISEDEVLIGMQAGSSLEGRRWPAQSFARLADLLAEKFKARIILFGVKSEFPLAEEVIRHSRFKHRLVNLAGRTSLSQMVGLLKKCRYLVTNDTGPMHIAAALGTPVVGLFFAHAHPFETGPYGPGHLVFQARISCAPCSYGVHCNNIVCVEKVRPEHVFYMLETHRRTGEWTLSSELESVDEVSIYRTLMNDDGRLELQPLVQHAASLQDIFRLAYTGLWLKSLENENIRNYSAEEIFNTLSRYYDCRNIDIVSVGEKIKILRSVRNLGDRGVLACREIMKFSTGKISAGANLTAVAEAVEKIDSRIFEFGCTHPEIKPITDMFVKRKENLQGENPFRLAQTSMGHYRKLSEEVTGLSQLLENIIGHFELREPVCQSTIPSM